MTQVCLAILSVFSFSHLAFAESGISILKPGQKVKIDLTPVSIVAIVSKSGKTFVISGTSSDGERSLSSAFSDLVENARHLGLQMGSDFGTTDIIYDSSGTRDEKLFSPFVGAIKTENASRAALMELAKQFEKSMAECRSNCAIENIKFQYHWVDLYRIWQTDLGSVVNQLVTLEASLEKMFGGTLELSQFKALKTFLNSLPLKAEVQLFEINTGVLIRENLRSQDLRKKDEYLIAIANFYRSAFREEPLNSSRYLPGTKVVLVPVGVSVPPRSEL